MSTLIEKAYQKLEDNEIVGCVSICLRLARLNNDYLNSAMFLKELVTDDKVCIKSLFPDILHFNRETQKYILEKTNDEWREERTISYQKIDIDEPKILVISIGELVNDIKQREAALKEFITPTGMTPFDTASFEDENQNMRARTRLKLRELNIVLERIRSRCLNYLITFEKQISIQENAKEIQLDFFNEVNNFFKVKDDSVYKKLSKALELIRLNDDESYSLLLTEIRRAIEAVANYFYPPQTESIKCSDGKERILGKDQYLNRLSEFIYNSANKSTGRELLLLEFETIDKISHKLNDLSSKGVHNKVSEREAKQCLFSFYNFVSNLIFLYQADGT